MKTRTLLGKKVLKIATMQPYIVFSLLNLKIKADENMDIKDANDLSGDESDYKGMEIDMIREVAKRLWPYEPQMENIPLTVSFRPSNQNKSTLPSYRYDHDKRAG